MTVWNEHAPGVDVVMDLKKLTFAPGSVDEIYSFHVLDHLFPNEVSEALANWKSVLKKGSNVFIVVDDFEYVARAFIGGDIDIGVFNDIHSHPMNFRRESLIDHLAQAGFLLDNMRIWNTDVPSLFQKKHYELVMAAQKHD